MERSILRGILIELVLPRAFEMHSVGQYQPCQRVEYARRDKILDLLFRLLLHPLVDLVAGLLGSMGKVHDPQFGPVICPGRLKKSRQERVAVLAPEAVRHSELIAAPGPRQDSRPQMGDGRMQFGLVAAWRAGCGPSALRCPPLPRHKSSPGR